ncbi:MAG: hypothetical protein WDO15_30725 [Bacteroidota bacterium]
MLCSYVTIGIQAVSVRYDWIYLVTPVVGITITVILVRYVIREKLRPGTWHVLLAIAKKSSKLDKKETYSQAVTAAITVSMGGSVGSRVAELYERAPQLVLRSLHFSPSVIATGR